MVDAFDVDPAALAVTRALAALNGVENRVRLHAKSQPSDLSRLAPNTVVVMDGEGAEAHLLTDDVARSNADAAFIVKCHNSIVPGIDRLVAERFRHRHVTGGPQTQRVASDAPQLDQALATIAMDEHRDPRNCWLVIV